MYFQHFTQREIRTTEIYHSTCPPLEPEPDTDQPTCQVAMAAARLPALLDAIASHKAGERFEGAGQCVHLATQLNLLATVHGEGGGGESGEIFAK